MGRKLIVEVCNAHNLMPKDGQGTSSPYVIAEFDGQRSRTQTKFKELNPQWDEKLEFLVHDPETMPSELLEINVLNDKKQGKRSNFLGRLKIYGSSFVKQGSEKLIYYPLDKRSVFSQVKGELGLKIYYLDEEPAPPPEDNKNPEEAQQTEAKPDGEAPKAEEEAKKDEPPPPVEEQKNPESGTPPPDDKGAAEEKKEENPNPSLNPPEEKSHPTEENSEAGEAAAAPPKYHQPVFRHQDQVPVDYALEDMNRSLGSINGDRNSTYDLVEPMGYLYVRVLKARDLAARDLDGSSDPYAKIRVGNHTIRTRTVSRNLNPFWDQVFALSKDKLSSSTMEISLWDEDFGKKDDFLGLVSFDLQEIPTRVPPDSPLAPQWYRLEGEGAKGDFMVAVWMGTQADEAFPEAWQSDTGGLLIHTRSKVYLSPKLWYLLVNVIEAQDIKPGGARFTELTVKAQLGPQSFRTRSAATNKSTGTGTCPFWNEDLIFVAAEPFEEELILTVMEAGTPNKDKDKDDVNVIGYVRVSLHAIERRFDHRQVSSLWFNLQSLGKVGGGDEEEKEKEKEKEKGKYNGRLHLRLCFEGGYHVLDEAAHLTSDVRPTAKQLWKPPLGVLEVGILGAKNLLPMKSKGGRGSTDAYCVAKYGQKWIRTRTVVDNFNPRWNEQYTWEIYDPCTLLTLGVFDNSQLEEQQDSKPRKDLRIGKVRVRISTLESDRIYTNSYPLLVLYPSGIKKMGEIELAVRFSSFSLLNVLHVYTQPLLPKMHYLYPLGVVQQDVLRHTAMKIVSFRLARSEPALRQEVVHFMLDTDTHMFSMRRSKANWFRIMNLLSGPVAIFCWFDQICKWKNPLTTVLFQLLYLILLWYPELILPTIFLYMFLIGAWNYRHRPRMPPHMDTRLSCVEAVNSDELDEEFDTFPTSRSAETVRMRYDRLRSLAARIQSVLGDLASQGERFGALLSWRDPRATAIFLFFCLFTAVLLYVTPFRVIGILLGLYLFRHPKFRDPLPSSPLNYFRRLPPLSDRIL
ncbi:hypothetical protein SUGI_0335720 [Cryptomeria japonica]|uniref:multiple C2 domain and transmembrane region protein 5 n=1 Tax=Cryptomeria japonica TaxID=3369 RepID=UPI002408EE67|nr:multiple C2 domain and transmembrane region protein 5 [Cryptomeria japonica]GLJ18802.1 hypothetical protein SUGI_0335720 [Cryptomeria japonica]